MTAKQQPIQLQQAILRPSDVCKYLRISRTKLHTLHETDPDFPRKICFSPRCVGWRKVDIDSYLEDKAGGAA